MELVIAAVLAVCRARSSSQARYLVACLGLAALLAAPIATAVMLRSSPSTSVLRERFHVCSTCVRVDVSCPRAAPPAHRSSRRPPCEHRPSWNHGCRSSCPPGCRASCCSSRGLPGRHGECAGCVAWRYSRRCRDGMRRASASRTGFCIRNGFRIVDSMLVDVPSVIGTIRPVILLPVAALTSLTPDQIEALLAHELAHIRRRDYAVNIAQTLAEALLFFHPAVWWMSARIREEREHCCDDIAVDVCAEPVVYASALAEIASWRRRDLALSLGAADGALLARVRRILREPEAHTLRAGTGSIALALAILVTAGAVVRSSSEEPPALGYNLEPANRDHQDKEHGRGVCAPHDRSFSAVLSARSGSARRPCRT